jgi:ribosomal protein S18 acetylase RimI-like enzyme
MRVTIRKAVVGEADAVLACLHAAFAPYRSAYSAEGFADTTLTRETFIARLEKMTILVAETDGRIVGTIACSIVEGSPPREGHLRGMAVLPETLGSGVAAKLLAAAEDELRRAGCEVVTLDTTAPLQRAIRFYERNGYRATGKVGDFYGMPLYEYAKRL